MGHAIRVIAPNQTELITTKGYTKRIIFFSYETPVIVTYYYKYGISLEPISSRSEVFVTNEKHSATTSKHINKYLGISPCEAESVSQDEIYRLTDLMDTREE